MSLDPLYAFLAALCSLLLSIGVIVEIVVHRKSESKEQAEKDIAEAEERGRFSERYEALERKVERFEARLVENASDHNNATIAITKLDEAIAYIKARLDDISNRLP